MDMVTIMDTVTVMDMGMVTIMDTVTVTIMDTVTAKKTCRGPPQMRNDRRTCP
jgi:hypothetical protein